MANENLTQYVEKAPATFQKMTLELYLENLRSRHFPQVATAVRIFRFLYDLMMQRTANVFSFMEECGEYLKAQQLTPAQEHCILSITCRYLQETIKMRLPSYDPEFERSYLPFFTTLLDLATDAKRSETVKETDVKAASHEAIKIQLLVLVEEMKTLPIEKRIKVLSTLVRTLAQYEKLTQPANPKPRAAKKSMNESVAPDNGEQLEQTVDCLPKSANNESSVTSLHISPLPLTYELNVPGEDDASKPSGSRQHNLSGSPARAS